MAITIHWDLPIELSSTQILSYAQESQHRNQQGVRYQNNEDWASDWKLRDHRCVAILIIGEVAGSAAVGAIRFVFDRRWDNLLEYEIMMARMSSSEGMSFPFRRVTTECTYSWFLKLLLLHAVHRQVSLGVVGQGKPFVLCSITMSSW